MQAIPEDWKNKKVQVGKDQEKAQSEKDSQSKNRGGKKQQTRTDKKSKSIKWMYGETFLKSGLRKEAKLTIRYKKNIFRTLSEQLLH